MAISLRSRTYAADVQKARINSKVVVAGWIEDFKLLGKMAFLRVRDRSGNVQVVVRAPKSLATLKDITRESVLAFSGAVVKSRLRSGGKEVIADRLEVLSKANTPLPIDFSGKVETGLAKRLDNRFLDLRTPKAQAIFRVRDQIFTAIHEYFSKHGFVEMHTPKIAQSGAEGGAANFPVVYFGKKAYLSQSQQLYKQMMMATGFDRVYEIGPTFRAEKSHTMRHITEFSHLDVEMAFINSEDDVLKIGEGLLVHVIRHVKKHCKPELELLNVTLNLPRTPFPRVPHMQAIELLQKAGVKIKQGADIDLENEKKLGEIVKRKYGAEAYYLSKFPWKLEVCKFYWMRDGDVGRGADLEYKGEELFTGAQREHRYDILVSQIKEKSYNPTSFASYLHPFKFGMPPHGGFGLGVDRLVKQILGIDNIREVVLFPRDPERLTP